jgi:hypothetical protein
MDQFLADLIPSRAIFRAHELFVCSSKPGMFGGFRFNTCSASVTRARLIVTLRSFATRLTSRARLAGIVTL